MSKFFKTTNKKIKLVKAVCPYCGKPVKKDETKLTYNNGEEAHFDCYIKSVFNIK